MKKQLLSLIAIILTAVMLLGVLAACKSKTPPQTEPNGSTSTEGVGSESSTNEKETDKGGESNGSETSTTVEQGSETEPTPPPHDGLGEHSAIIQTSNSYKNNVLSYYTDSTKKEVTFENMTMNMGYGIVSNGNMQISHLSSKSGGTYISNTMDVVLNMENGKSYLASKSLNNSMLNIYRYGYYYFENRIEGQRFTNDIIIEDEYVIDVTQGLSDGYKSGLKGPVVNDGYVSFQHTGNDPWIRYNLYAPGGGYIKAENYDFIEIVMKQDSVSSSSTVYLMAGDSNSFSESYAFNFVPEVTDDFVTYIIPLNEYDNYYGDLKSIRFDINTSLKDNFHVKSIRLIKANYDGAPEDLTIQRSFVTYSDKLHHVVQFSTPTEVTGVKNVQIVTRIAADTVEKFIIKDKKDIRTDLDSVIWSHVEYAAFDIKGAGVFGYILPYDEQGTLSVTLEDGYYVITHTKEIENGTFIPSKANTRNANDVFMGARVYNDENHDFEAFILAAEGERTPLEEGKHIIVDKDYDDARYIGYDALYGFYKFSVKGTGFNGAYYQYPNKQFRVHFTVKNDNYDRTVYFMTYTNNGALECAALLDGKDMLLPVPLQVSKNFVGDGENTIYNLDDAAYGEVYFPITLKSRESKELTVLNLYQNWGKFPLKQISSIQFFTPYYHLSTGVTETNCIVQLATCGPGLPDHRAMSAPFWPTQPQHNSGGSHSFLSYSGLDGQWGSTDNTSAVIDSYGPTYCDITLEYEGADGAIHAQYTHTEMPQTDENRAYYELKYTFMKDITFNNFMDDFRFYNVTDNNPKGTYKRVGYLDKNNESQVAEAVKNTGTQRYILGTECPYFTFFDMPDWDKEWDAAFGYTNLSFLIYNYEIIINGEKTDANFVVKNTPNYLTLSLNLKTVSFKAGDTITINAILMPWGSQELDGKYDEIQDNPVREVRKNTLLNPLHAIADANCEVIESVFLPKVRSTNGKNAEFTLAGGHNNVTVRAYGFDKLTSPVIEECVNGEWVPYDISSKSTPDDYKNGYYYDGYMVHYDEDGTFSYSFVVEMNNGAPRKFRISADKDFEGWPEKVPSDIDNSKPDPINVFVDPDEIFKMTVGNGMISGAELGSESAYIRLFASPNVAEAYLTFYNASSEQYKDLTSTGQYFAIKYRLPSNPASKLPNFEIFTSTEHSSAQGSDQNFYDLLVYDDQWHVIIFDASKMWSQTFKSNEYGLYKANFLRVDFFNGRGISSEMYIDLAYVGFSDSLEEILKLNTDMTTVALVQSRNSEKDIDPNTGEEPIINYIDPESGFTKTEIPYAAWTDQANGKALNAGTSYTKDPFVFKYNGKTVQNSIVTISGWTCAEGGIEKYVWSVDGGKTWNDIIFSNGRKAFDPGSQPYFDAVTTISKYTIQDTESSKVNVRYQGGAGQGAASPGIAADLTAYIGQTVNVTFAAIPKADPDSLCLILHVVGVQVVEPEKIEDTLPNDDGSNTPYEIFFGVDELSALKVNASQAVTVTKMNDSGEYVRFARNGATFSDGYVSLFTNSAMKNTGKYFIIKYRTDHMSGGQIWANTLEAGPANGSAQFVKAFNTDGNWHLAIVDLSTSLPNFVKSDANGNYAIQWARFDILDNSAANGYFDVAFIVFCDDVTDIKSLVNDSDLSNCTHYRGTEYINNNDGTHSPICGLCGVKMATEAHSPKAGTVYDEAAKKYVGTCNCGEKLESDFLYSCEAYLETTAHTHTLRVENMTEGDEDFLRISGYQLGGDPYTYIYRSSANVTGQYMMIKYRLHNNGKDSNLGSLFYASTMSGNPFAQGNGDGGIKEMGTLNGDGEWHYIILDLVNDKNTQFIMSPDGTYSLKYFRISFEVSSFTADDGSTAYTSLDVGFVAFADNVNALSNYVEAQEKAN